MHVAIISTHCEAETNGCHFAKCIFKVILFHEHCCILIQVSLKFVLKDPIDKTPTLIHTMALSSRVLGNGMKKPMIYHKYIKGPVRWPQFCRLHFLTYFNRIIYFVIRFKFQCRCTPGPIYSKWALVPIEALSRQQHKPLITWTNSVPAHWHIHVYVLNISAIGRIQHMFFRNAKNGAVREWLCPSDKNNYLCFENSAFIIYYVGFSDTMCEYIYWIYGRRYELKSTSPKLSTCFCALMLFNAGLFIHILRGIILPALGVISLLSETSKETMTNMGKCVAWNYKTS